MASPPGASDFYRALAQTPAPMSDIGSLHLVLGRQCNVRCEFCYQTSFSPKDDLPAATLQDQLLPYLDSVGRIVIQGGEPTVMKGCKILRDKLAEVDYAGEVAFVTNGKLFGDDWIKFLVERPGPSFVNFSLNASNASVYDAVIKYGNFDVVMSNINKLLEARKTSRCPIRIRASFVLYEKNMWDILDFANLFIGTGVDEIIYFLDGRSPDGFWKDLPAERVAEFHQLVKASAARLREKGYDPTELATLDHMLSSNQQFGMYLEKFEAA